MSGQLGLLRGDRLVYRVRSAAARDITGLSWDEAIDAAHGRMETGSASVEVVDDREQRIVATGRGGWLTGESAP